MRRDDFKCRETDNMDILNEISQAMQKGRAKLVRELVPKAMEE